MAGIGNQTKYYFYKLHNGNTLRIQFWHEGKKITYSRSLAKYGLPKAKKKLLDKYYKITHNKVIATSPVKVKTTKPSPVKQTKKEPELHIDHEEVDSIDDLPWQQWFNDKTGRTLGLLCRSRGGKTTMLARVYKYFLKDIFDATVLSSGTINAEIYKDFKDTIKMSHMSEQMLKTLYSLNKHTKGAYKLLYIADDLNTSDRSTEIFTKLITKYRNYNISSIISVQDYVMLSPPQRQNIHILAISGQGTGMEDKRVDAVVNVLLPYASKTDIPLSKKKDLIASWLNDQTQNFGFVFIDVLNSKVMVCRNKL